MIPLADADAHPWILRQELLRIGALTFEQFAEITKGRTTERYRSGRILALIAHGEHIGSSREESAAGAPIRLLAIVNHTKLARRESDWRPVHDCPRRAWEFGEITHPVRLDVVSLQHVNQALADGIPHFVQIASEGIALYASSEFKLVAPNRLSIAERRERGHAEFSRWIERTDDFLSGARFYHHEGRAAMAALLVHQACEHLYQSVIRSLTLHGRQTHAIDKLREDAERLDSRLAGAWPRAESFERRAFGCIRRAYIEARYGQSYHIRDSELTWAIERAKCLRSLVEQLGADRLGPPEDTRCSSPRSMREGVHVL